MIDSDIAILTCNKITEILNGFHMMETKNKELAQALLVFSEYKEECGEEEFKCKMECCPFSTMPIL